MLEWVELTIRQVILDEYNGHEWHDPIIHNNSGISHITKG
jgi:hypothetical protein